MLTLSTVNISTKNYIKGSLKGVRRNINQDGYVMVDNEEFSLFLVFDGVGSALNAKRAVEVVKKFVKENYAKYLSINSDGVINLMYEANNHLLTFNYIDPLTTYCLLFLPKNKSQKTVVSNLGDSRVYGVTNQSLTILSEDDSLKPDSNIITKCLGRFMDKKEFRIKEIDFNYPRYLLCTDGFYHVLNSNKIDFFETLNGSRFLFIKKRLDQKISGNNFDDSTYILVDNV